MKPITEGELKQMMESGESFELINVLDEDAFRQEHIPGSINIPVSGNNFVDQVERRVGSEKNHPIVVYCANTECTASPTAAEKLEAADFTNIFDYEAGMDGWKQAGHTVERGEVHA